MRKWRGGVGISAASYSAGVFDAVVAATGHTSNPTPPKRQIQGHGRDNSIGVGSICVVTTAVVVATGHTLNPEP